MGVDFLKEPPIKKSQIIKATDASKKFAEVRKKKLFTSLNLFQITMK